MSRIRRRPLCLSRPGKRTTRFPGKAKASRSLDWLFKFDAKPTKLSWRDVGPGLGRRVRYGMQNHGRQEHHTGEENIPLDRALKERHARPVASHEPTQRPRIHVAPRAPDGEIADHEERDRSGERSAEDRQRLIRLAQPGS